MLFKKHKVDTTLLETIPVGATAAAPTVEQEPPKWLELGLQILAYAIPLGFLAYVLYINYLPFGYDKTFTIDVGSQGDTDSSQEFYLEPSQDLSERKTAPDGTTYRELNGMTNVVFKPNVVLKDAKITVSVEGEGVEIIPPVIDFNPNSVNWDYDWDFTRGKTPEELGLKGNAYPFDGSMYFDGSGRLELASSSDLFEDEAFSIFVDFKPINYKGDNQQIIGHFNWEVWQNTDSIEFRVGRMNDSKGEVYIVKHNVEKDFFNNEHTLIVIYDPSEQENIRLYVDNKLAGSTNISGNRIYKDYNGVQNLSMGWTPHNYSLSPHFEGKINRISILNKPLITTVSEMELNLNGVCETKISLLSFSTSSPKQIRLHAIK